MATKRLDLAAASRARAPDSLLQRYAATVLDDAPAQFVLECPTVNAEALREEVLPYAWGVEVREDFDLVKFRTSPIDARLPRPSYPPPFARDVSLPPPQRDAFVIQFNAPPREEWLQAIRAAGLTVLDYVPENAYTVLGAADAVAKLAVELPIQLLRPFEPIHRVDLALQSVGAGLVDVNVVVAAVPEAEEALTYIISTSLAGVTMLQNGGDRQIFGATMPADALGHVASLPAVLWVEKFVGAFPSGEREAHLVAGDTLVTNSGGVLKPVQFDYRLWLTQKGVSPAYQNLTVGILDTGFDSLAGPQIDFKGSNSLLRVTPLNYSTLGGGSTEDCMGHGTLVAGVINGNAGDSYSTQTQDNDGSGYFYMGLGVAPQIKLVSGRIFTYLTSLCDNLACSFNPQSWDTIYADLANRGVVITNNSWNEDDAGYTATNAAILDKVVRQVSATNPRPMAIFVSAGNTDDCPGPPRCTDHSGTTLVSAPATAKNVVSVGASEGYNLNNYSQDGLGCIGGPPGCADNGNQIWSLSRNGPTRDDGRRKPDVVAPGTGVEGPKSTSSAMGTGSCLVGPVGPTIDSGAPNQLHLWSRGTSFASPAAAGAAAFLHQWFKTKTATAPSPALLKAMLINLAYDLPTLPHAPEAHQGWGKADLTRAFKTDGRYSWVNQGTILTQSAPTYTSPTLTVKNSSQPVRITLVWTDPPGGMTSKQLVNDLNLLVASSTLPLVTVGNDYNLATGHTYVENPVGPLPYDHKNNVEQVTFLASELSTSFWISINAAVLAGDALTVWSPSSNLRQDFALFVENVVGQ